MQFSKMTGAEKAAILLLCLGEEATGKVFSELSNSEIKMISRAMVAIEHVPADVAEEALNAYTNSQQDYAGIFIESTEFVKKAINSVGDPKRVSVLMDQVATGKDSSSLETIAMMQPKMVSTLLEHEHPQTLALVLSTQKPEHTGKILSFLPEELKAEVMYRISKLDKVSPDILKQIEAALQREIGVVVGKEKEQFGGIDKVVEILHRMEKGVDRNILIRMEETDPEMADAIRKKMFTFEDLLALDNRAIQTVLKEVNSDTLTMAMKTASDELKTKIFNNISNRAAEMIKEDLEVMGPTRLSEVEAVQQQIVQIAMRLEDEGQIVLPGRGGRDVLV